MARSIFRRCLLAALTVVAGGFISATLLRYAPGFGSDERQLDPRLSSESLAAMRNETAEERGIFGYYAGYWRRAWHGDLGMSRSLNRPVRELLGERAGVTCRLGAKAILSAWVTAALLLCASWLARAPVFSLATTVLSGALLCLPAGGLALLCVIVNAPAWLALALILLPKIHRYLDNLAAATNNMPHILTAQAKGLADWRILLWHVFPVIRREVLALAGVSIGLAISAAIPVEALCGIPGIGQLAWQSALARDLPLLINLPVLVIASVTLANSGADLLGEARRLRP
jgi:peptide/nickel transport system permease protein